MELLAELGLSAADGGLMLIAPPDSVLAEAGRMRPRPSIASTLYVAEPAARIAWWPERRQLTPAALSRLRWMLEGDGARAWLIIDATDDDALTPGAVRGAVTAAGLTVAGERSRAGGESALEVHL
ncbi:MAG: hypothetical protein HYX53_01075 [Chloroflexi bacterium]|nr:hypothetical protein [Chloroflexota bacterium]